MELSKTWRACLVTGVITAGVTAAAGPGFANAAIDKVQDVFVTNSDDRPVPVKVTNQPAAPEVAEERVPWQQVVKLGTSNPEDRSSGKTFFDVPAGQRLTITHIGALSGTPLQSVGISQGCVGGDPEAEGAEAFASIVTSPDGAVHTTDEETVLELASGECAHVGVYWQDPGIQSVKLSLAGYLTK